ncbi:MAG TPA: LysR family transcriptional regulator [Gammaproteobacteria bacterium]|nr:LysR family transcriptional regulator [Gammaproteobacteria bacterium]
MIHYPSTRQLECLVAVADTLNFREAAQRLNLSQPPLSRHIKALESLVGVVLFKRDTHSVHLTDAGAILAEQARNILHDLRNGLHDARMAGERPKEHLNIGFTQILNPALFPNIERTLRAQGNEVSVHETYGTSRRLMNQVASGRIDIAVVVGQQNLPDGLRAKPFFSESLLLVISSDIDLPAGRLSFRDLPNIPLFWFKRLCNPLLYDRAERLFWKHAYQPELRPKPNYREALFAKIIAGEGMAFLSGSLALSPKAGIVFKRFESTIDNELQLSFELIKREGNAHIFLGACEDIFSNITPHQMACCTA